MAVGVNLPYTDRTLPVETWRMLERLQPDEITLTSFASESVLTHLCKMLPEALYHVRPRTGPQNQSWAETYENAGTDILGYRSWPSERSMLDCLRTMIGSLPAGAHPRGCHRVTVLMGNEPTLEWAPPYPTLTDVKLMARAYEPWFSEQVTAIYDEFAGVVGVAVAPAAEGDADREMMYMSEALRSGCYDIADSFVDHNYFPPSGGGVDDPDWGGRSIRAMDLIGWDVAQRGRARVTEANDNGEMFEADPQERARLYADYIAWTGRTGLYESVSLFTLPGAPDDASKPAWWFLTNEIIDAVRAARDELPDMHVLPTRGVRVPVSPIPPATPPETRGPEGTVADAMAQAAQGGQTLTADELHAKRWAAYAMPTLPEAPVFNAEFGFERAWRKPENSWWGSPLTVHEDLYTPDPTTNAVTFAARVFANAVVIWEPGAGASVLD